MLAFLCMRGPTYRLLIVMQDDTVERMRKYDPVVIDLDLLSQGRCIGVDVAYVKPEDLDKVMAFGAAGDLEAVVTLLFSGVLEAPGEITVLSSATVTKARVV